MKLSKLFAAKLGIVSMVWIVGCATTIPKPTIGRVTPTAAFLANEDVVITSLDGTWSFKSGTPFVPNSTWNNWYYADYLAKGEGSLTTFSEELDDPAFQKVMISKSGYDKPFYGVLVFSRISETGEALAQRRWQVAIPGQYFRSASNGGISVVFGPYDHKQYYGNGTDGYTLRPSERQATSWILWMSDLPLW